MKTFRIILRTLITLVALAYVGRYTVGDALLQNRAIRKVLWESRREMIVENADRKARIWPSLKVSCKNALAEADTLLDQGKQLEAEEMLAWALLRKIDEPSLFAEAVMYRSRGFLIESSRMFYWLVAHAKDPVLQAAADLALQMDQGKFIRPNMTELVKLSNKHSENNFLLWLSAIESKEQGYSRLARKRFEKALARYEVGPLQLHMDYAELMTEQFDEPEIALRHYRIIHNAAPDLVAQILLANALYKAGHDQESAKMWQSLTDYSPVYVYGWYMWGKCLGKLGKYEEAVEKFESAYALDEENLMTVINVAMYFEECDQRREAIAWYMRSIIDMGITSSWISIGNLYARPSKQGKFPDYEKARASFEKGLELGAGLNCRYGWLRYATFLTTCPDEHFRDYPYAIELAKKVDEASVDEESLALLASAYELDGQQNLARATQHRLDEFKKRKQDRALGARKKPAKKSARKAVSAQDEN